MKVVTIAGSVCVISLAIGILAVVAAAQERPGAMLDELDSSFVVEPLSEIECGNGSVSICSQRFAVSHPEGIDVPSVLRQVGATTGVEIVSPTRFETVQSTARDSGEVLTGYAVLLVCLMIALMAGAIVAIEAFGSFISRRR